MFYSLFDEFKINLHRALDMLVQVFKQCRMSLTEVCAKITAKICNWWSKPECKLAKSEIEQVSLYITGG